MATYTPLKISAQVTNSATTLVSAGADDAIIVSLDFQNITASDVTLDVWTDEGGTLRYLFDDVTVPAHGHVSWRGNIVLDTNGHLLRAQSSAATSVDCKGAYWERS